MSGTRSKTDWAMVAAILTTVLVVGGAWWTFTRDDGTATKSDATELCLAQAEGSPEFGSVAAQEIDGGWQVVGKDDTGWFSCTVVDGESTLAYG